MQFSQKQINGGNANFPPSKNIILLNVHQNQNFWTDQNFLAK